MLYSLFTMSKKNVIIKAANMRISKISNAIKISALLWFMVNCSNSSIENNNIKSSEELLGSLPWVPPQRFPHGTEDSNINQSSGNTNQSGGNTNQSGGNTNQSANGIEITYKINEIAFKENKIKLFGADFVKNNKGKCMIIYDGKRLELTEYLEIQKIDNTITIKLIGINNITNMRHMFYVCKNFISIEIRNISNWNTSKVTDMSCMFAGCQSLTSLPDISKWNTENVTNMECMFQSCTSLVLLGVPK